MKLFNGLLFTALLALATQANALQLFPADADWTTDNTANPDAASVATLVGYSGVDPLQLLYKANVGGTDEGIFKDSYDTVFSNTSTDPMDALISYVTGASKIDCGVCYLLVKDGNNSPALYAFDISNIWNGTDSIDLQDFWPQRGAISNVAIWGGDSTIPPSSVPAPATLGLLGLGLVGLAFRRRNA